MFYSEKVLIAGLDYRDCYYEGDTPSLSFEECDSIKTIIQRLNQHFQMDALKQLLEYQHVREALEQLGWVDAAKAERLSEKVKLGSQYYTYDKGWSLRKVDLEHLNRLQAEELAKDEALLLQVVNKSSLKDISSKAYRDMLAAKKKIAAKAAAAKEKAAVKAQAKKAKELEKAKALLKEEGVL